MGSKNLFKSIMGSRKAKDGNSNHMKGSGSPGKSNGFKWKNRSQKTGSSLVNSSTSGDTNSPGVPVEDIAAVRIQTAFRAYWARKLLRRLKGTVRLQALTQAYSIKKQATNTINYLHSWSKIQAQLKTRRLCMVAEGQLRQKKMENQQKLEAKLHDLEFEWSGGPETIEESLSRIHQREEAAVRRERAMAYAFSHQWRANSNCNGLNNNELAKANWGWSWVERWVAARPWESRLPAQSPSPNKLKNKQASKLGKTTNSPTPKASVSVKTPLSNGKGTVKPRRLSYPGAAAREGNTKPDITISPKEVTVS